MADQQIIFTTKFMSATNNDVVDKHLHVKYFDIKDNDVDDVDEFGLTPKQYLNNETEAYKVLNNVKYTTSDGRKSYPLYHDVLRSAKII